MTNMTKIHVTFDIVFEEEERAGCKVDLIPVGVCQWFMGGSVLLCD